MSVYKPRNSPFFHFDFQLDGNRFHGSTGERTRRRAEAVERDERRKAAQARDSGADTRETTLNAAAGEYWRSVSVHQASAATTEYQIENLLRLLGATTLLSRIRDAEVADYVRRRRGEAHRRYKQHHKGDAAAAPPVISAATVNREVELLGRIVRRAARVLRAKLPAEPERPEWRIHKLIEADPPDRPLTREQEARYMAELVAHARPIVDVALLTGLRRREVMTLDCENLDLTGRKGRVRRKSRKPGGEWFTFDITEDLLAVLAPHVDARTRGPVWRFGPPCTCAVCAKSANHGRPIKTIRSAHEGARKRAGLPQFRMHDLRHTVGSRILQATGNLKAAQDYLGHKDISTTLRYAHHAPGALADVQRQLSGMRKNGTGTSVRDFSGTVLPESAPKRRKM